MCFKRKKFITCEYCNGVGEIGAYKTMRCPYCVDGKIRVE
jgi:uncharacterized Zn-finger protein